MIARTPTLALTLSTLSSLVVAQEAAVPFDLPQVQLPGYSTSPFQRLFDFDGDGDLDAVGARVGDTSGGTPTKVVAEVWENSGDGRFSEVWEDVWDMPTPYSHEALVAVGDLDGDGNGDFALTAGAELWRFTSNAPAPGFTQGIATHTDVLDSLAIADFDGDGSDDVAYQIGTTIAVDLSSGGTLTATTASPSDHRDALFVADTDGDALPDIVRQASFAMQPFSIEAGTLTAQPELTYYAYSPNTTGADIDGDGDTDLVAFHLFPPSVEVFRRTGPSTWIAEPLYAGGPAEYLADIDGDGDPDGVCCSSGGGSAYYPSLNFDSTFEISVNENGVFGDAVQIPGLGARSLAGAADVDGDGDTDLVAGRCVYFNRGSIDGLVRSEMVDIQTAEECADLDGDGDLDAWVESAWPDLIETHSLRNRGDGSAALQPMVMEPAPEGTKATGPRVQGDFDGDGDTDVILGISEEGVWGAFLRQGLWLNSGGGSFQYAGAAAAPGVQFYVDSWAADQAYLVGDLEADGDLDIVMRETPASWSSPYGATYVYLNDGTGFFEPGPTYSSHQPMAITDFDLDGINDMITATPIQPGGVRLVRGLPQGSGSVFGPMEPLSDFWGFGKNQYVDIGDFNHDGYPDVATVAGNPRTPRIYLNGIPLGLGTTLVETEVSTDEIDSYETQEQRAFAIDANLDGLLDVVAGPVDGPSDWRVYLQKSGASPSLGLDAFEPGVGIVLSEPALVDDIDGDGDPDIWGEYLGASTAFHGTGAGARLQYGAGSPGTGGIVPTLGATGPFRAGEEVGLHLRGASGDFALYVISLGDATVPDFVVPGVTLLVDPFAPGLFLLNVQVLGSGPGEGGSDLDFTIQPGWAGLELYHQALVVDRGAPSGLLSATQALRLTYGP